jgi:hypothetical protein
MNVMRAALCERLETRAMLSVSVTVTADAAAVKAARQMLQSDHARYHATLVADSAAIPRAIANIAASIDEQKTALMTRVANDLNQIAVDEYEGPHTIAADVKAERKDEALLKIDQARGNASAASAESVTLQAAQMQLANDRVSTASRLAMDRMSLTTLKASEGQQVRTTKLNAIAAVHAAKVQLINDTHQSQIALAADKQNLADALSKLKSDLRAGN